MPGALLVGHQFVSCRVLQLLLAFWLVCFSTLSLSYSFPFNMPPRYSTRSSQRMMSTQVKVTSYNVLSSHLAAPQYFRACKPEFLDAKYRLESLKSKLESECATNAVICLQEVSHTWSGKLHAFFAERNYHFVTALYGNRFDNYMGIAIAVPIAKYDLLDVNIQKVSDTKVMPPKVKPTFLGGLLLSLQSWVLKVATMLRLYKAPFDVWYNILYRHNQMLCARLRDKETAKSFIVSTYHMPCMFQYPSVMVAHTALSAQHALKYATQVAVEDQKKIAKATEETNASSSSTESPDENVATAAVVPDPIIFCGDYNFKPESSMYQVITHGGLESRVCDYSCLS